ncbi:MAG: branched-chain amino acid ABC transporter permease [Haloarculaceae archaeon]
MTADGLAVADVVDRARTSGVFRGFVLALAAYVLLFAVGLAVPGVAGVRNLVGLIALYFLLVFLLGIHWRHSDNDVALIAGFMLVIYVAFAASGMALGLDLNGIVNTLRRLTFLTAVYAMLVLALNLHWGYAGLFNIGVAGFMAVGVYTMAMLTGPVDPGPTQVGGLGLPLWVGIVGGMVAAAIAGFVAALPALRLRADYLAIVTVAMSEILRISYLSTTFQDAIPPLRFFGITFVPSLPVGTGGGQGISMPTNPILALFYTNPQDTTSAPTALGSLLFGIGRQFDVLDTVIVGWAYAVVLFVFVIAFYWLLVRVGNSPFGRVLKAIREDELVAKALGKNTRRFKITTFMLGCALMGLAAILWQGSQGFTNPGAYRPIQTFYIFLALIIGGAGSNTGSVVGGAVFASVLFEGPPFVSRLVSKTFELRASPGNFGDAVAALGRFDFGPLFAYTLHNISTIRFILLGVLIIALMQRRPDGLFGHRKEVAAAVDLSDRGGEDG